MGVIISKLSIIFALITIICIFSVAAIADQCGCRALITEESKDTEEAGAADGKKEEEPKEEEPEEPLGEETPPEEQPPEEEQPDEGESAEAPTITLEVYEGATYSSADGVCYYRIKANVTGTPAPDIEFSKDDSNGAWGQDIVQINLPGPF